MAKVTIERGYLPTGTFGNILVDDVLVCHSVELPWRNNKSNISCIPVGVYELDAYSSPKHGNVFIVSGGTVDKFARGPGARWGILFHVANFTSQLEGCIAPVSRIGVLNGEVAGLSSEDATRKLFALLDETNELIITHKKATLTPKRPPTTQYLGGPRI